MTKENKKMGTLLKLEVCPVECAVVQFHHKLTASTGPSFFGLPDLRICVGGGIIRKTA
jgi:hypothetical protein